MSFLPDFRAFSPTERKMAVILSEVQYLYSLCIWYGMPFFSCRIPSRCSIASKKCNLPFKTPSLSSIFSLARDAVFLSKENVILEKRAAAFLERSNIFSHSALCPQDAPFLSERKDAPNIPKCSAVLSYVFFKEQLSILKHAWVLCILFHMYSAPAENKLKCFKDAPSFEKVHHF